MSSLWLSPMRAASSYGVHLIAHNWTSTGWLLVLTNKKWIIEKKGKKGKEKKVSGMKTKKKIDRSIGRVRRETRDLIGRKGARVLIQFCQLSKTFLFLFPLELPQCLKQQNEKKKKRASCNSSHFSAHWCSKHCVEHLTRKKLIIFVSFGFPPSR